MSVIRELEEVKIGIKKWKFVSKNGKISMNIWILQNFYTPMKIFSGKRDDTIKYNICQRYDHTSDQTGLFHLLKHVFSN